MGVVRVVVATDDGRTVHLGHFGDARYYAVVVVEEGGRARVERLIENPFHGREGHGEQGKRRALLELLQGADAVVSTAYGPGGTEFFEGHGVRAVRVRPGATVVEAALEAFNALGEAGGRG